MRADRKIGFFQKNTTMYVTKEIKAELFKTHGASENNTGSPEGQIALFTHRISHLTDHLNTHPKDHNTEHSLLKLVGKRRRLLSYLKNTDIERYRNLIKELNIRK